MSLIRPEEAADIEGIRRVLVSAFDTALEADLVEALRVQARPLVSIVAIDQGEIVGHILFSRVTHSARTDLELMVLAPMAVSPDRQRRGIGSALVLAGLDACRDLGAAGVVVVGHPAYYPKFGFVRASSFGVYAEFAVPDEAFMALELVPGALSGAAGMIHFHPAFAGL